MPKRLLGVQIRNKGEDDEPQTARLSSKRPNTTEPITVKKAKIVDKENIPKRQTRQSTKSKESEQATTLENLIEPIADKTVNLTNDDSDDELEDDEVIEETPVSTNDDGKDYPSNKQYIIYEKTGSNKEPFIISKTARFWFQKYRKVLDHVIPDAYGLYIHNDFSNYGELEVVENCLLELTKAVFIIQQGFLARLAYIRKPDDKVNYILGFRRLEALTILLDFTDGICGIDDGERFYAIIRVIGACYITILRGLLPSIMFKKITKLDKESLKRLKRISKQIPNFKQVLERSIIAGHLFNTIGDVCSTYTNILQIVYCNWVFLMEKISIDFNDNSNKLKEKLWDALKHADSINEDDVDRDEIETFDFMKELRLYKEQYGLGGDSHDLRKWSQTERSHYALGRFNDILDISF